MKLFVFGNELVKEDSLARHVARELRITGIELVPCDSVEEMLRYGKSPVILYVVKGLKEVRVLSIDELQEFQSLSSHDIDLGYELKLLKEMGQIGDVRVLGIPQSGKKEEIKKRVAAIICGLL